MRVDYRITVDYEHRNAASQVKVSEHQEHSYLCIPDAIHRRPAFEDKLRVFKQASIVNIRQGAHSIQNNLGSWTVTRSINCRAWSQSFSAEKTEDMLCDLRGLSPQPKLRVKNDSLCGSCDDDTLDSARSFDEEIWPWKLWIKFQTPTPANRWRRHIR